MEKVVFIKELNLYLTEKPDCSDPEQEAEQVNLIVDLVKKIKAEKKPKNRG